MRKLALALVLAGAFGVTRAATAQEAAGNWLGTIEAGGARLRLAVHIAKGPGGALTGTMDSLDQGAVGIPLAAVTQAGDALGFEVPKVGGRYDGRWEAAKGDWVGTWRQAAALPLTLVRGEPPAAPVVTGLDGDWDGALKTGVVSLRLALHVKTDPRGTIAGLDSIDQGTNGIPVASIARDGQKISFKVNAVGGTFEGALSADGASIAGTWTQGGPSLPLTLNRRAPGVPQARLERPQTPKPPFPYRQELVKFDSPGAGAQLAGTLTLPPGKGPFPAVVLISGSGPNGRNETVMGHQIFLVLADHLTRSGLAVLRYDKRGVGQSGGDYLHATTRDFALDAEAATAWLRARPEIDPLEVGLVGHSEGGLVAPLVAASDPRIAFMVLLAAPGLPGAKILDLQQALIARAMGASEAKIVATQAVNQRLYAAVEGAKDGADAKAKALAALGASAPAGAPADAQAIEATQLASDWFRFFLTYDPVPALKQVKCPVLALWGSKDLQVPPAQDLPPVRAALAADPQVTVEVLPGLNHLFQTADTGSPTEYATIEETMSPAALDEISAWIEKRVAARGAPTNAR
jgi:hypothetical protein